MTTVIERTEGHYEVYEIPYGKDYVWNPGRMVVECECGERPSLTATETTCECGADHTTLVQAELNFRTSSEETPCPEGECQEWRRNQEEYLHSEYYNWLEWEQIK